VGAPWTNHDVVTGAWTALHDALEAAVRRADDLARERGYGTEPDDDARIAVAKLFIVIEPLQDNLNRAVEALLVRAGSLIGATTRDLKAAKDQITKSRDARRRLEHQRAEDARERDGR
jgi:hypothetical protein